MKYLRAFMALVLVAALGYSAADELTTAQASVNKIVETTTNNSTTQISANMSETIETTTNNSTNSSEHVNELRKKFQSTLKKGLSGTTSAAPVYSTIIKKRKFMENGELRTVTEKEIMEYIDEDIITQECVCECDCSKECQTLSEAKNVTNKKIDTENTKAVTESIKTNHSESKSTDQNHYLTNLESCADIMSLKGDSKNGVYTIYLHHIGQIKVYCYKDPMGTGCAWTLFMRRKKTGELFDKNWQDYQRGFGEVKASFFLGLDNIHALTSAGPPQELGIFTFFETNHIEPEKYAEFRIGDESTNYMVEALGRFSRTSLIRRLLPNSRFSTKDMANGEKLDKCADFLDMGWWYSARCKAAIQLSGVRAYLNAPVVMGVRPRNCKV